MVHTVAIHVLFHTQHSEREWPRSYIMTFSPWAVGSVACFLVSIILDALSYSINTTSDSREEFFCGISGGIAMFFTPAVKSVSNTSSDL